MSGRGRRGRTPKTVRVLPDDEENPDSDTTTPSPETTVPPTTTSRKRVSDKKTENADASDEKSKTSDKSDENDEIEEKRRKIHFVVDQLLKDTEFGRHLLGKESDDKTDSSPSTSTTSKEASETQEFADLLSNLVRVHETVESSDETKDSKRKILERLLELSDTLDATAKMEVDKKNDDKKSEKNSDQVDKKDDVGKLDGQDEQGKVKVDGKPDSEDASVEGAAAPATGDVKKTKNAAKNVKPSVSPNQYTIFNFVPKEAHVQSRDVFRYLKLLGIAEAREEDITLKKVTTNTGMTKDVVVFHFEAAPPTSTAIDDFIQSSSYMNTMTEVNDKEYESDRSKFFHVVKACNEATVAQLAFFYMCTLELIASGFDALPGIKTIKVTKEEESETLTLKDLMKRNEYKPSIKLAYQKITRRAQDAIRFLGFQVGIAKVKWSEL